MSKLQGKVAVVTGAGRGIGRAISLGFAQAGASICCAARTMTEIEAVADEINATDGGRAIAVPTDVTDLASVAAMFERVQTELGGLDILVINAGAGSDKRTVEEGNPEDWVATINVNLTGAYYCARAAIPYLKQRGTGKIITIGSGLGHRGTAERSSYACSKAGLWMLTRVLAQELWPHNISVNELIPGPVDTSMTPETADWAYRLGESEWLKKPEDVVPLALFLATQPDVGPTAQSFNLMRRDG